MTITAQLADANGNPVSTAGMVVAWSKTGTGGSFSSPTSTTIAANGFTIGAQANIDGVAPNQSWGYSHGTSAAAVYGCGGGAAGVWDAVAKSATIKDQVTDAFYLKDIDGKKIKDSNRLDRLRDALLESVRAGVEGSQRG